MSEVVLGKTFYGQRHRDAVHVAILPVVATEKLHPGQQIGLIEANGNQAGPTSNPIGIVDPFLTHAVLKGYQFWMFLFPNTVTGMRHHWSHPMVSDETVAKSVATKEESEEWLRNFVQVSDCPDYDTVLAAALGDPVEPIDDYYSSAYSIEDYGDGPCLYFGGRDAHSQIPDEFWDHVENLTGRKCPVRAKQFTCSC